MIIEQTENIHAQIIILLGQPEMSSTLIRSKHHILNHASQNDLQQIIQSSRFVIARSG
jgi:UDP-N-acetylglucosamine transferase subunit ALG13